MDRRPHCLRAIASANRPAADGYRDARMNGRELAERMVELQPGLKIIYMSGYTDEVVGGAWA